MFISDFAIKRPILTVVFTITLVLFGIAALVNLEVDEFPAVDNPVVSVSVAYPGATPSQVEREVIDKIEEAVNSISGLDEIASQSLDGFGSLTITFEFSKNTDQAMQDVRDAISGIRGELPPSVDDPILRKFNPADQPIVSMVLSSKTHALSELTTLAEPGITKELRGITGVAQVTLSGAVTRAIEISVRPVDLQAAGLSFDQVASAVSAQNLSTPVGRVSSRSEERTIRFSGRLQSAADFANAVLVERNGRIIRLRDVADVIDGHDEQRTAALFGLTPAIALDVRKSADVSTTRVAEDVLARVDRLRTTLPEGVELNVVKNSGDTVRQSVTNVEETLLEGALLTVLVVFVFLNSWRSTVITGLALPVSVIAAFIPMWLFGFTLNTMSLLGMALAIGILIDDAIVVRENIVRHIEMGSDHVTASHTGTNEIGVAVAATTFCIVAVFVPVAWMGGIPGQFFKPFALTIAAAVLVSLFVSFSLDPMLSAYWPDPIHEAQAGGASIALRKGWLTRLLDRFNHWFERQSERYARVITWALDHRWSMAALAVGSLVISLALQLMFGGTGFVPPTDRSEINLAIETPPGSSVEYTKAKAQQVVRMLGERLEVRYTYTTIGSSTGSGEVDTASIYARLVRRDQRAQSQEAFAAVVRRDLEKVLGANVYVYSSGFGGNQKQVQVQLHGSNEASLAKGAAMVASAMQGVPGAVDVGLSTKGERPEVAVELDRDLAGSLGVTARDVANSLRPAFAGIDAGDWIDPSGETRDVTVRLAPESRSRASDLGQLPLVLPNTAAAVGGNAGTTANRATSTLRLDQIATVTDGVGPARIDHLDRGQVITVGANVSGGRSLSEVSTEVNAAVAELALPAGVVISQGGQVENQTELFLSIATALVLAMGLMYLILVVLFESFLDPFAILISLPLSLIGVVAALLITGDTLNMMSLIGIMLLMGIVAKNAILLIDYAKTLREKGLPLREALVEAGRVRLRPIIMTTVALIAGMVPVALGLGEGGDFRSPLGRAVIGGTISSTVLTLLVIPTVYLVLSDARDWILGRLRRRMHRSVPVEG